MFPASLLYDFNVTFNTPSSNTGDILTFIFCRAHYITGVNNGSQKDHYDPSTQTLEMGYLQTSSCTPFKT